MAPDLAGIGWADENELDGVSDDAYHRKDQTLSERAAEKVTKPSLFESVAFTLLVSVLQSTVIVSVLTWAKESLSMCCVIICVNFLQLQITSCIVRQPQLLHGFGLTGNHFMD